MKRNRKALASAILIFAGALLVLLPGCGGWKLDYITGEEQDNSYKVGFLYINEVHQPGWIAAQEQGRQYLQSQLDVETIVIDNVKPGQQVEDNLENLADKGCRVIFATSFEYAPEVLTVAARHPEIKFMQCDAEIAADNVSCYFGRIEEADYLAGMTAGLMSKSGRAGIVVPIASPEVYRDINAFILGMRRINPQARLYVSYSGSWYDPAAEKQAAQRLLAANCDVLAQKQGSPAVQEAAQAAGVYSIGYHTDMRPMAPGANLCSAVWNWGPLYVKTVQSVMDGSWKSQEIRGGIASGMVDISPVSELVPAQGRQEVEKARNEFLNGQRQVFTGPVKDQTGQTRIEAGKIPGDQELLKMDWLAEGVEMAP